MIVEGTGVSVGIEGSGTEGPPETDGSELGLPVGDGDPGVVKELVLEEPVLLGVIVEPALVNDGWLDGKLVCDTDEELTAVEPTDEEPEGDRLPDVELGIDELLGGKGIGVTIDVLLELDRSTELNRVVTVGHTLDVWFDMVGDRLELELCPGGMTTVVFVDDGSAVDVLEDWALLLRSLVVLKTVEFPYGGEEDPAEEVSVGGRTLKVGVEYVLKMGDE